MGSEQTAWANRQSYANGYGSSARVGALHKSAMAVACSLAVAGWPLGAMAQGALASAPRPAAEESPGEATLEAVTVSAPTDQGGAATTEGSRSYKANAATIGKTTVPLKDIPQSVTVVTRQQMEDQNLYTLESALKTVTGATVVRYDASGMYNTFNARGFGSDTYQFDGVAIPTDANGVYLDLALFDRIEVLRGAAGLFSGAGEPGVTINLARKRALPTFQLEAAANVGSWKYRRADLDVTGPLIESGRVRGRLVAALQDNDTFMKNVDGSKKLLYGTVEADVAENTTVSVGAIWQDVHSILSRGLPTWADGTLIDLPRSAMPVLHWNRQRMETHDYFAELEHRFANKGTLKATLRRTERTNDGQYTDPTPPDASGWMTGLTSSAFARKDTDTAGDIYFNTPLQWSGRTHNLLLGMDWRDTRALSNYAPYPGPPTGRINLFDPDPNAIPEPTFNLNANLGDTRTKSHGAYGQLRVKVLDDLTLIGGGRLSWWKSAGESWGVKSNYKASSEFTPYAAAVYQVTPRLSVYGSYSQIFKPQNSLTVGGEQIKPRTGSQIEFGLKGDAMNSALQYSAAVFRITDQNRAIGDPVNQGFSIASGKVRSQGFETEVRGRLTPNWQIAAGYAYTTTKYLVGTVTQTGQVFDTFTPKHNVNLWVMYAVPANILPGLEVGAGVRSLSSFYSQSGNIRVRAPGYTVASLTVGYRINRNLKLALNVDNLFDKVYWEKVSSPSRQNFYGAPRSINLSMRGTF